MTQRSPFRYFKTEPEIIRLAVMLYVRFPLSLRYIEDLLHKRGYGVKESLLAKFRPVADPAAFADARCQGPFLDTAFDFVFSRPGNRAGATDSTGGHE